MIIFHFIIFTTEWYAVVISSTTSMPNGVVYIEHSTYSCNNMNTLLFSYYSQKTAQLWSLKTGCW